MNNVVFLVELNVTPCDREVISTHRKLENANKVALDKFNELAPGSKEYDYEDEEHGCFYSWDEGADITVRPLQVVD
jgi:hypothetical protein